MQSSKKKKTGKAKTKEISLKLDINLSDDEQDAGRS